MVEVVVELGLKAWVAARCGIGGLDREHQRHQGLGDKAPAINAEMAALVRTTAKRVRNRCHSSPSARAAARKAAILPRFFSPGRLSTPEDTSTAAAPEMRTASGNSSAVSPPDSIHGQRQDRPAISAQSKARPLPPGRASDRYGCFASNSSRFATSSYPAAASTSSGPATATAFITGRPKRVLASATRSGLSPPWN